MTNSYRFLKRTSVVVPKATAATARLLGRPPRPYREYVTDRATDLSQAARSTSNG